MRVELRSVNSSLYSKHSGEKQNTRQNYYRAYYWVTVGFVQMIRNWHVSSSCQEISFVGRVCVHRQWQSQMSHQHVRSAFLFNPKHVGEKLSTRQNNPLFDAWSNAWWSIPSMTWLSHFYFWESPAWTQLYIIHSALIIMQELRLFPKLVREYVVIGLQLTNQRKSLSCCYYDNTNKTCSNKGPERPEDPSSNKQDLYFVSLNEATSNFGYSSFDFILFALGQFCLVFFRFQARFSRSRQHAWTFWKQIIKCMLIMYKRVA